MSEKSIDQRFAEATERLRTEGLGSGDVEGEYFGVLQERARGREEAIETALAEVGVGLSVIERKALDLEVSTYLDRLDQVDEFEEPISEAAKLAVLRNYVVELVDGGIGEDGGRVPALRFKGVVAFELEYFAHDDDVPDGILGQALDQVIDQLTPYVARKPGWQ
ncbi:MAG: hypothetical protein ACLFWH_15170 [Actinomycetota bacterium]